MTDPNPVDQPVDQPVDPERVGPEESEPTGPRVTDKRRLDPETGAVRDGDAASGVGQQEVAGEALADEFAELFAPAERADTADVVDVDEILDGDDVHPDTTLAVDLTRDLQRLQAEYVNYKKRVDRDREMHRDLAVCSVVETLLPVLDDIHLARQHGDLEGGPFAAIADKLDGILTKIGVERFGQPGDAFDPTVHEALMHIEAELAEGTVGTTVVKVLQPGYRMGERLIRVARVAVADPPDPPDQPEPTPQA